MIRKNKLLLFFACIILVLSACSSSQSTNDGQNNNSTDANQPSSSQNGITDDEIRIAGVFSLSGAAGVYGSIYAGTAQMVFDEVNESGGINGRKIVFTVENSAGDPSRAVAETKKMVNRGDIFAF